MRQCTFGPATRATRPLTGINTVREGPWCYSHYNPMNRPRNRQPRPPRAPQQNLGPSTRPPSTPQQIAGTVPTVQQVVPGTSVAVVLKENQSSGRETQGIVQQLLTRGNHPRGIKVRLQDGQVGRVQRLTSITSPSSQREESRSTSTRSGFTHRYTDARANDAYAAEPPLRSLADFMPASPDKGSHTADNSSLATDFVATVKCPFCDAFEGDEVAVSHHIESHLDGG